MNWEDLKVLLALTRHGSTRTAAVKLGVSNTTVSRRLDELEEQIGGKLFDRTPEGFKVTALAEKLLPTVKHVEDLLIDAERSIAGGDTVMEGSIRVNLHSAPQSGFILSALAQFAEQYPEIKLDIFGSESMPDLSRREADFSIRGLRNGSRPPKDIVGSKLGRLSLSTYVHKDLLSASQKNGENLTFIRVSDDLIKEYKILPRSNKLIEEDEVELTERYLKARHTCNSIAMATAAVRGKLGASLLPCYVFSKYPGAFSIGNDREIVRPPDAKVVLWGHIWLMHHKDLRQSARIRALFSHLRKLEDSWPQGWDNTQEDAN
ncbi:MAG: LysR family transcriptional regulator [Halieaceae bacterium]|nr:LysR family transcriptional regulator [Halieaceae bacterium]